MSACWVDFSIGRVLHGLVHQRGLGCEFTAVHNLPFNCSVNNGFWHRLQCGVNNNCCAEDDAFLNLIIKFEKIFSKLFMLYIVCVCVLYFSGPEAPAIFNAVSDEYHRWELKYWHTILDLILVNTGCWRRWLLIMGLHPFFAGYWDRQGKQGQVWARQEEWSHQGWSHFVLISCIPTQLRFHSPYSLWRRGPHRCPRYHAGIDCFRLKCCQLSWIIWIVSMDWNHWWFVPSQLQEPVLPGCFLRARAIGLMPMIDQGEKDDKIIAVCADDPEYRHFKDIKELPPHRLAEIRRFFEDCESSHAFHIMCFDLLHLFKHYCKIHNILEHSSLPTIFIVSAL